MHTRDHPCPEFPAPTCAELVDSHYAELYRFAVSLARDTAEACDLTQQTFLIWTRKGDSLRDKTKARTWLFTTLYREFLSTRRGRSRVVVLDETTLQEVEATAVNPDLVRRMDGQLALEALQEVDAGFRETLALFYLQDLSYAEIADVLSIPIGTVMSRLSRGKEQLRRIFTRKSTAADGLAAFASSPALAGS